jgi:hypothetical protein
MEMMAPTWGIWSARLCTRLALDLQGGGRMFVTDFGGSVYCANFDGSERRTLLIAQGNLMGIAYLDRPPSAGIRVGGGPCLWK